MRLADIMQPRADVKLSVHPWHGDIAELGFLRFFRWLEWLSVSSLDLRNLDGVTHLPQLRTPYTDGSRHRLSLAPLTAWSGSLRATVGSRGRQPVQQGAVGGRIAPITPTPT